MTNLVGNYSLETDTSGWANVGGPSDIIARENSPYTAVDGTWYGTKEATGTGARNTDYAGLPVTPGSFYSAGIYVRWKTGTPKRLRLDVRWFDSTGTSFSTISGTGTTVSTSTWTQLTQLNLQAPAVANGQLNNATSAAVRVLFHDSAAIGDIFAFDAAQFNLGSTLESLTPAIVWNVSKYVKFGT